MRLYLKIAAAVVFHMLAGAVSNTAALELVTVGDQGNSPDPYGLGSVAYVYNIGKYETTNAQYVEFLNAVAHSDPYALYNEMMASDSNGGIARSGQSGSYSYTIKPGFSAKPVTFVSWFDAARFCNWFHNGKPISSPDATEDGAYALHGALTGSGCQKSPSAKYWIPNCNEWSKAAYFDPLNAAGPGFWRYPTRSNSSPGTTPGAIPNQVNYAFHDGGDTFVIRLPDLVTVVDDGSGPISTTTVSGRVMEIDSSGILINLPDEVKVTVTDSVSGTGKETITTTTVSGKTQCIYAGLAVVCLPDETVQVLHNNRSGNIITTTTTHSGGTQVIDPNRGAVVNVPDLVQVKQATDYIETTTIIGRTEVCSLENTSSLTDVGAFSGSFGPYGTFDQGGSVSEWNDPVSAGDHIVISGGSWLVGLLKSQDRLDVSSDSESADCGFRIAALPTPFDMWAQAVYPPLTPFKDRLPSADPDRDGITNLMEYALGGSPKVADAATIAPAVDYNGSQIQFSFPCNTGCTDLIYTVQSSTDLAPNSWTDIAQSTGGGPVTPVSGRSTVTDPGTGARTVTVSTALPVGGKLFLRINVVK